MKYLVAGNYAKFSVTLTQKSGELITPYIPTEGDVVQISLYGARRFDYQNYEQSSNVLTFEDNGCLNVGLYCLEVKITEANTHKLRCMYREQIRVVASNDDVPTDASFSDDDVQLSGQFDIVASTEIVVDDELSLTSTNPVQNKVVTAALNNRLDKGMYWDYSRLTFSDAGEALDIDGVVYVGETEEIATITAYLPVAGTLDAYNNPLPGVMTATDKTKLDGIEAGANKTLFDNAPTAGSTKAVTSGGIYSAIDQVAVDLSDTQADVVLKANYLRKSTDANGINLDLRNTNSSLSLVTIPFADANTDGIMSSTDFAKLAALPTNTDLQTALNTKGDALASQHTAAGYEVSLMHGNTYLSDIQIPFADAQNSGLLIPSDYSKLAALPTADTLNTTLAGKADGISTQPNAGNVQIDLKSGNTTLATAYILDASASNNGLMSSTDFSKLAGIATGATRVIVDSTFDTTSSNAISNSAVATALGDIDTILDNINGD